MSDLVPYEPTQSYLASPMQPEITEGEAQGTNIISILRRRWKLIATIWLIIVAIGVPYTWMRISPTVTATARIEIVPQLGAILFSDTESRAMPFFGEFIQTQAQKIAGPSILSKALEDPTVQALPDEQATKSFRILQKSIEVSNEPKTHLLLVEVTQPTRVAAVTICDAVVRAYMDTVSSSEGVKTTKLLDVLNSELTQLQQALTTIQSEIDRLISEYDLPEGTVLDAINAARVESSSETRRVLEEANLTVIDLQLRLQRLKAGDTTVLDPEQVDELARQQFISTAPTVRALEQQLAEVSARLLRYSDGLTEQNPIVVKARNEQTQLKEQLTVERERMAEQFDGSLTDTSADKMKEEVTRTENKLKQAQTRQEALLARVNEGDEETLKLSRQQRQIAELVEQREMKRQQYDVVNERIRAQVIESQRPTRVNVESDATVLADGTRDKRVKYTLAAVLGGLFFGFFVALLRDRMDSHLYGPQQIESHMGMRLLGSVPCLSELKAGRVTHEDFVESYRVVRATLSSLGPNGSPPQCLLITSAQCGEGKTSLAISLSASLAETGSRVLLVDADLQAPSIHHFFKIKHPIGLDAVLAGDADLLDAIVPAPVQGVDALCAGVNGTPSRHALDWRSAQKVITEAKKSYDYIVIDTPPTLGAADAIVWSRVVNGVVVSSLSGHSDTSAMRLACQRLRTVGANLLGAVVANVSVNETYYSQSMNTSQSINRAWDDMHQQLPLIQDPKPPTPKKQQPAGKA